jgi:4'-phosphopantetheinyl transferase
MSIYWLEQNAAHVPQHDRWLGEREMRHLNRLQIPKRRTDWRLGRWTAKQAVSAYLQLPRDKLSLRHIEIIADSSGAPAVFVREEPASLAISLSHRSSVAACSVTSAKHRIGCDIELAEPRSDAFLADYFTVTEQDTISRSAAADREILVTALWSAKESALKALHLGLRLDTRCVSVCLDGDPAVHERNWFPLDSVPALQIGRPTVWRPLRAYLTDGQSLNGWWHYSDRFVRTVATSHPSAAPVTMTPSNSQAEIPAAMC